MNASKLTAEQRTKLIAEMTRHRDFLGRLKKRMESTGWYTDDPVYQSVVSSWHSMHAAVNGLVNAGKK